MLKPIHTEGVAFARRKTPRARCAKSNILAQVLNQSVVYLERRVESLAACMPQLNNTCANFYAKDLTLNAGQQCLRCAWAITRSASSSPLRHCNFSINQGTRPGVLQCPASTKQTRVDPFLHHNYRYQRPSKIENNHTSIFL